MIPMSEILFALFLLLSLMTGAASAQQRTIYGSDGTVIGRVTTDSQGSQTIYGADGRVTGRTSTDSQGTTTSYDDRGRTVGTTTSPQR